MRELRAAELRTQIQSWRKAIPAKEKASLNQAIQKNLLTWFQEHLEHSAPGHVWGSYRPLPWEWDLSLVLQWLSQRKVSIAYPRVEGSDALSWHLADPRIPGHWGANFRFPGLQEPEAGLPEVDPATLYGVIVPGVAFSLLGERIGAGGGFYDRFLSKHPGILRVAVAAEGQILPSLPDQRLDEPRMQWLVSERRELKF